MKRVLISSLTAALMIPAGAALGHESGMGRAGAFLSQSSGYQTHTGGKVIVRMRAWNYGNRTVRPVCIFEIIDTWYNIDTGGTIEVPQHPFPVRVGKLKPDASKSKRYPVSWTYGTPFGPEWEPFGVYIETTHCHKR
jgi:hypothetical protein